MNTSIRYIVILTMLFVLSTFNIKAQKNADSTRDYKNNAAWIGMIDNPNTNYYEAIKAFDTYFQYHRKPMDEDAQKTDAKDEKEGENTMEADLEYLKTLSQQELHEYAQLKYQVKRFENWIREMKPFVQDDGRILTDAERMEIWKKQQDELKKQQK